MTLGNTKTNTWTTIDENGEFKKIEPKPLNLNADVQKDIETLTSYRFSTVDKIGGYFQTIKEDISNAPNKLNEIINDKSTFIKYAIGGAFLILLIKKVKGGKSGRRK